VLHCPIAVDASVDTAGFESGMAFAAAIQVAPEEEERGLIGSSLKEVRWI